MSKRVLESGHFAASLAMFMLSSGTAVAQTAPVNGEATPHVSLPTDSGEILVTARKRSERLLDVPAAVSAISAESIQRYNITTLAGMNTLVPTLALDRTYSGSGAVLSIRGVGSSFQDNGLDQSVLLNLDGVPISRGRIINDAFFDVEVVEVLKGPQALFFGKNSPGGVVTIRSRNPTDRFEGYGKAAYEFATDEASFEGAVSGPISDMLRARLAGYASRSEGNVTNRNPGVIDPFVPGVALPSAGDRLGGESKIAGRLTLDFEPSDDFSARLKFTLSKFKGANANLQEVMGCPNGNVRPSTLGQFDTYGDCRLNGKTSVGIYAPLYLTNWPEIGDGRPLTKTRTILPSLTLTYNVNPDVTLTSVTALYDYIARNRGNIDGTAFSAVYTNTIEDNTTVSQELRFSAKITSILDVAAGFFYENSHRDYRAAASLQRLPADPATGRFFDSDLIFRNKSHAYSGYAQITLRPSSAIELAGGARYTHEEKSTVGSNTYLHPNATGRPVGVPLDIEYSSDNVSPEATATWHITRDLTSYVAYKTGYLSGAISNPGAISASASAATLTVNPTKAKGWEGGIKTSQLGGRLTADISIYRYIYTGLQLTAFDTVLRTFRTSNAASTVVRGVEVQGNWAATDELSLRGAFAYNDAHYTNYGTATCYAGQTAATGCSTTAGIRTQDLSGEQVYAAPKYVWNAGATYRTSVTNDLDLSFSADVRRKSGYFVSLTQNPNSYQDGFALLDGSVTLDTTASGWQFSLIGRNLTNRIYGTLGADKAGGSGEATATAALGRTVMVQVMKKF